MPILALIGGNGFLGRRVAPRFAAIGWRVRVGTRNPDLAGSVRVSGSVGQVEPFACDLRHPASVAAIVAGTDAVVNLAGILQERGGQRFAALHAEGAGDVARLAREAGAGRLVHVSALGADPDSPSRYARSKAEGEHRVRDSFPGATLLRPSILFGEGDRFFTRFARMAVMAPVLPLIGADTRFQPAHVEDVAEAIRRAVLAPDASGMLELGGPQVDSFRGWMQLMLREIRRRRILLPLPFGVAHPLATACSLLPAPPITPDQVELLRRDSVVAAGARGFAALGIEPNGVAGTIGPYLERFRPGGQYWKLTGRGKPGHTTPA